MEEHPIQGLMTTAMENIKNMVEVNTIIGDPVESPDGSVIIPLSKLGFGFAAGGSEFNSNQSEDNSGEATLPFRGASSRGVYITTLELLIVHSREIKMIHINESTHIYEKMLDYAPKAADKIKAIIQESNKSKNDHKQKVKKEDSMNFNTDYDI